LSKSDAGFDLRLGIIIHARQQPSRGRPRQARRHRGAFFPSDQDWIRRLSELGLTELTITPDPGRVACEGALREGRRLGDLVIVSDGAGQFRVGKTGYAALDSLLRLEDRLMRVLERPKSRSIPTRRKTTSAAS
jgi:hypothetical protein